jgi:glycine cleavage system H protein
MSHIPADLHYTKEHEWVAEAQSAGSIRMGITDFAQSALGDIVYVQMPTVGETVTADKVCGEVESTKSVSEIFAPVTGVVTAVNESLVNNPELVNSDPYGAGWLAEISLSGEPASLLTAAQYGEITG